MSWASALVAIVAVVVIGFVLASRQRAAPPPTPDQGAAEATAREAELQREVEALRERIQVLERIATEDREVKRLASDIEKLRDE